MVLSSVTRSTSWCRCRFLYRNYKLLQHTLLRRLTVPAGTPGAWRSQEVRETFLEYFKTRDHQYVHSSSVVPRKDEGSYFVNAGMNQFKPIFLGTVASDSEMARYQRVVNSQKCIRVGGKHNDLSDVGRDSYHHTFFEMLGSWSFGDYFKEQACSLAWDLMTNVYGLPKDRLFVTYFGGNESLGLGPDLECKDIWLSLGLSPDHVLPFGSRDNFWDMGDTGPCGPCTEIHYSWPGTRDAAALVNAGSPSVVELWNLVFMQYDRQSDGCLRPLPSHHVDTGMGLERIAAVLQGKVSNYDTDLFAPLFDKINKLSGCPIYRGMMGVDDTEGLDTAYRIVADHIRMATVAMGDGVRPGRSYIDSKLRQVLDQCIHQASQVLRLPPGALAQLVPLVVESLGTAFPELGQDTNQIMNVVNESEERYLHMLKVGRKLVKKVVEQDSRGIMQISGESLMDLQDGIWGMSVPVDLTLTLAREIGVENIDVQAFNTIMNQKKLQQDVIKRNNTDVKKLTQQDVMHLQKEDVRRTEHHYKYQYGWDQDTGSLVMDATQGPSTVLAIKFGDHFVDHVTVDQSCGLLLDKTTFYAEAGGQRADIGEFTWEGCRFEVSDVQETQDYVVHSGRLAEGSLSVGDQLTPDVSQVHRAGCSKNHTATHLLNLALDEVLGDSRQQGSSVTESKLVFDFTCNQTKIKSTDIEKITQKVREIIRSRLPVHIGEVPLQTARGIKGIKLLHNEVYPSMVRVMSIGVPVKDLLLPGCDEGVTTSVELCGGTHVDHTGRIQDLVITHFHGMQQGTKRVTAITGQAAVQATKNAEVIEDALSSLESLVSRGSEKQSWTEKLHHILSLLTGKNALILPKVDRDKLMTRIDLLKKKGISAQKNKQQLLPLASELEAILENHKSAKYIVATLEQEAMVKQVVAVVSAISPLQPMLVFVERNRKKRKQGKSKPSPTEILVSGVAYVPKNYLLDQLTAKAWATYACDVPDVKIVSSDTYNADGTDTPGPDGSDATNSQIYFINFLIEDAQIVKKCVEAAGDFVQTSDNST